MDPERNATTRFADQLSPLSNTEKKGKSVSFPDDLDYLDHVATFRAVKRSFMDRNTPKETTDDFFSIHLPLPAQLNTGYNAQYTTGSGQIFGIVSENAAKISETFNKLTSGNLSNEDATNLSTSIMQSGAGAGIAFALSQASKIPVVGEAIKATGGLVGAAINPHKALLFEGTDFRKHSFSYNLIARSKSETEKIKQIIRRFKWHMSTGFLAKEKLGRSFFTYPDEFIIEFRHSDFLFKIGRSVLDSFTVNYHGDNTPAYFRDNRAPVNVQINMSFTETTITTREEIFDPDDTATTGR
jgi:hypothetical protein